jgi:hypothetical protein
MTRTSTAALRARTLLVRIAAVVAAALCAGCVAPSRDTWIGSNVGVAVDSFAEAGQEGSR